MRHARRCIARLTALFVVITPMGCATSPIAGEAIRAESPPRPSSADASVELNLARLASVSAAFPAGLEPEPPPGPSELSFTSAKLVGDVVSFGKPLTVAPQECRPLLKPVEARAGAQRMGIGAGGPQPPVLTVSAVDPISVPVRVPQSGCDRMTFQVEGAVPDGVAERLAAPDIEGATTSGLKVIYKDSVHYRYIAILHAQAYVEVTARMKPDFQPAPQLPDLLVDAVTAILG